jgi:hypothetical protein
VDFKSLYTLIPVEDNIAIIQKLVLDFQTPFANAHLMIFLLMIEHMVLIKIGEIT